MERKDIDRLIQLRDFVIQQYSFLDGKDTSNAITPTKEVAYNYESIIRSIEDVLSDHVTIQKR